ncbi:MAG: SpoVG family protein [Elusimicrobia bacterium]|nr:SpoVG family protein [Elusimicrobiota bacterium]
MKITDIKIRLSSGSSKIKAFAVVKFDDIIEIHSFKIVEGKDGLFVGMPSQQGTGGKFFNIVFITDESFKKHLCDRILEEYEKFVKDSEVAVFDEPEK